MIFMVRLNSVAGFLGIAGDLRMAHGPGFSLSKRRMFLTTALSAFGVIGWLDIFIWVYDSLV